MVNLKDFLHASANGHIDLINQYVEISPLKVQVLLTSDSFLAFREAARHGHLPIINRFIELAPHQTQAMISARGFSAFGWAAGNGHLHIVNTLIALCPDRIQEMIQAKEFAAFGWAAGNGHLHVVNRILELSLEQTQNMIRSKHFMPFRCAAVNGHLDVVNKILELAPDKMLSMIKSKDFFAFHGAAANGHLHIMDLLLQLVPDETEAMVSVKEYVAFRSAAGNGHLDVMDRLVALAPEHVFAMVRGHHYFAFRKAASNGHLAVMEKLIQLAPNHQHDMVSAQDYAAFRGAAYNGDLEVMERLFQLVPEHIKAMVEAQYFSGFRAAVQNFQHEAVYRLLSFPTVLRYVETHSYEYASYLIQFIESCLTQLKHDMRAFNANHPNAVFDVTDPQKAELFYYMMVHFIRRDPPGGMDHLRLLLEIPSVKQLAHQEVTPDYPNQLVRLALSMPNREAISILLNIPAVRAEAEANHYYRNEQRLGFDMNYLAQDRESSMKALTSGEKQRLDAVIQRYQAEVDVKGIPAIIDELKSSLQQSYQLNPAQISTELGVIDLPLIWDDYQLLAKHLLPQQRDEAMSAYYQHVEHTAYRYFLKPNPWMDKHADYVNRNRRGEGWSTFEEYQLLIGLLFLAAKDERTPAVDGFSIETRLGNFIKEISLIGRAHNWDASRINPTTQALEEYDDLQGDKPSCYSGVKRRLFQSVLGHPDLKILTQNDVRQELKEWVKNYFSRCIKPNNCVTLLNAWLALTEELNFSIENLKILEHLNVPQDEQEALFNYLTRKYPEFNGEHQLQHEVRTAFVINDTFPNHVIRFAGEINLQQMLEHHVKQLSSQTIRFFENKEHDNCQDASVIKP